MKSKSLFKKGIKIEGLLLVQPEIYSDERGFFFESWNQREFDSLIGDNIIFKQDNHSKSKKGVLRGLHYQLPPHDQGKLVRCSSGSIYDVAVDLRKNSPTFGEWTGIVLSDHNQTQFWIPSGFGHGFLTLSQEAEVQYKTTNYWNKDYEISLNFSDKDLNINLPLEEINPEIIQQSFKDINSKNLKEITKNDKIFI
tara:strand:- start:395 stop:982 length:588 start_codon:yes stop_codon:yes gene_type:complete